MEFIVTACHNGKRNYKTGSGFGIYIPKDIRENLFKDIFKHPKDQITIQTKEGSFNANLPPSFWNKCNKVKSKHIGLWLIENKIQHWDQDVPPKAKMEYLDGKTFKLSRYQE
ncbi:hypothetical protein [uncultured Shewanella sp.]|uniref:hypothetical protein n=1 Tax=uncultured Shewanella sp. TaxID=173975 RepID=UPI002616593D|nr:hypothetical protein [uncultured Shewanella sp.]